MKTIKPLNMMKWIEENRNILKPPVGNKMVWADEDYIIMVVGGPNSRQDYHVNEGPEFFYQLEGNMILKIINEEGEFEDLPINEGEIYLLRGGIPHCPTRPANSVGLVVESKRRDGEKDGFQWYCPKCKTKLYEEFIAMTNIEDDLPKVFDRFWTSETNTKCSQCSFVMTRA